MPCQSFQPMVSYLPDAGIKKPSGKPGTPVSQGKEIRAGEVYGRMVSFRLPDKHRGTLSDGRRYGKFRRTAEAPCDGTDGCVPFVLPPRCPASAIQPAEMVGNGRRDGTAPIFLITGNRKIKCGNLPLSDTGIIDWTKYHNSKENEKRCLVFDKRMTFKKELFFNQKLVFDERLFRLISDIKLE